MALDRTYISIIHSFSLNVRKENLSGKTACLTPTMLLWYVLVV